MIVWRKSSFSSGSGSNCVEVGIWNKSSFSNGSSACVEVQGGTDDDVFIRESDDPTVVVRTSRVKWDAFVKGVQNHEFDA